jgi:predicted component of type VI protein secretion system
MDDRSDRNSPVARAFAMMNPRKSLGVMRPLGGGDEIPLKKEELVLGRRPTCDIRLDFENISGKHCVLKFVSGTWHVRDLSSTNGTTVNGQRISSEHGLLPDDELGIAGHFFALDYDAAAPTSIMDANAILEEEMADSPRRHSLMELAGLEHYEPSSRRAPAARAEKAPERPARPAPEAKSTSLRPDERDEVQPDLLPDDDFFDMIRGDVEEKNEPKRRR